MTVLFALLAGLTLGAAWAAVTLRNLVHAALCLIGSLAGLGLIYIQLDAEFLGLAQILVYVGAVAILIVFAIMLVRGTEPITGRLATSPWLGGAITLLLAGLLLGAVAQSPRLRTPAPPAPKVTVKAIGQQLMRDYVVPLQGIGLLLTAATLGAALSALPRRGTNPPSTNPP